MASKLSSVLSLRMVIRLNSLEFAEEVLDQMAPFVDFGIDVQGLATLRTLGNDDLRAALAQVLDDPVRIERLVGNQAAEFDILDEWGHADGIRCPGSRTKRARLPKASVRARILVVNPPFDLPMAWL